MVYVANTESGTVTVIDGASLATSTVAAGTMPQAVAVNSVTNRIYVANEGSSTVTVIDGATEAPIAVPVGAQPNFVAVDPATNTIYVSNYASNTVTVIAERQAQVVPLGTSIVPLPGNQTAGGSPVFTFSAQSSFSPVAPAPQDVFFQVDTWQGPWAVATGAGSSPSGTVSNLQPGFHMLYAFADDGQDATSAELDSPLVGSITAYGFLVTGSAGGGGTAPAFGLQPSSQTMASGSTVVFNALAQGQGGSISYQWFLNGTPIPGAVGSTYVIGEATAADDGSYTCVATNPAGSVTSSPAELDVVDSADPGRLVDISCRAQVGTGASQLIAGYVVGGLNTSGEEPLLLRASGPALATFGVAGVLPDPQLQLDNSGGVLATNNGWGGNAEVAATAAQVGAFAWTNASSHDSALLESLPGGSYTAQISGASGDTGVALAEVYDATPAGSYTPASPRLANVSARTQVGTGANVLIVGFVIGGSTSKTVLVRASGPALIPFGVSGVLPDPQLQLNGPAGALGSNDAWGGNAQVAAAAATVGAFAWPNPSSNDSALLLTLPPGAYTAVASGASGDTGVALVEVYEVP